MRHSSIMHIIVLVCICVKRAALMFSIIISNSNHTFYSGNATIISSEDGGIMETSNNVEQNSSTINRK